MSRDAEDRQGRDEASQVSDHTGDARASASRVLIFVNPIAGRGRGRRIAEALTARLTLDGWTTAVFERQLSPETLAAELAAGPIRCVLAIGGDGTLRDVVERLLLAGGAGGYADTVLPPVLIVPLGTANLMGRHLGLPHAGGVTGVLSSNLGLPDPLDWFDGLIERFAGPRPSVRLTDRLLKNLADRVATAVARRRLMHVDLAAANGRLFLLMVGVGVDAHVVHALHAARIGPIHKGSYLLPALTTLREYAFPRLTVRSHDEIVYGPAPALAFVGNVPEYGTGFPVLRHARSDDGRLDLCVLPCGDLGQFVDVILRAAAGEHLGGEGVIYRTGTRFEIDADSPAAVQVDGDPGGHTPVRVELLKPRLPLVLPATSPTPAT